MWFLSSSLLSTGWGDTEGGGRLLRTVNTYTRLFPLSFAVCEAGLLELVLDWSPSG